MATPHETAAIVSHAFSHGPRPHRFSVDDYHRMSAAGFFAPDARLELVEGVVIDMAPIGPAHAVRVDRLAAAFVRAVGPAVRVSIQNPLRLDAHSEPQPDLALLRPRADGYESAHPGPRDVLLVVEVADSSLAHDRDRKLPLYARHGIPEAWLVDVEAARLTRCREPGPDGYGIVELVQPLGSLPVPGLPGHVVDLHGLFPEPG